MTLKYVSTDEIDQIRMQLWNIFDYAAKQQWGNQLTDSDVLMVQVDYRKDVDEFNCIVQLDKGIKSEVGIELLETSLLYLDALEINEVEHSEFQKLFTFTIKFEKRFFFRPLYTPYCSDIAFSMNNDLKYGLPLYRIAVMNNVDYDSAIRYVKEQVPSCCFVDVTLKADRVVFLVGSLITPPDEQMDFAAPAGYKFGKGKETRQHTE